MKMAIIFNAKKLSGKLTKFFTGYPAYHVGWVDEATGKFYDMHAIRRRRLWADYSKGKQVALVDVPEVKAEFLEHELDVCEQLYGFVDYALFGLRPIFHMFGQSTRNAGGMICSEMVANDMRDAGIDHQWINEAPPSPADLYRWALFEQRPIEFIHMSLVTEDTGR